VLPLDNLLIASAEEKNENEKTIYLQYHLTECKTGHYTEYGVKVIMEQNTEKECAEIVGLSPVKETTLDFISKIAEGGYTDHPF
jgi:hypothetical protein